MTYTKDSELKGVSEWRVPNAPLPILVELQLVANNSVLVCGLSHMGHKRKEEGQEGQGQEEQGAESRKEKQGAGRRARRRRAGGEPRKGEEEEREIVTEYVAHSSTPPQPFG